jgi:Adenylate and Guanylate cyclase catalytic domain
LSGPDARYYGQGHRHADKLDGLSYKKEFADFTRFARNQTNNGACNYSKTIYPTSQFRAKYRTNRPVVFTAIVVSVFMFTTLSFFLYDVAVQRRNTKIVKTAARTSEIVSSIFPKEVHKRILQEAEQREHQEATRQHKRSSATDFANIFNLGKEERKTGATACESANSTTSFGGSRAKPIADFFPCVTSLFADISGFTAWSSAREPSQVFVLLESIFHEFDVIAKRRGVYKVETVGDCYMAVCGLPVPHKDHVITMCRFARDCLHKVQVVLQELEIELGPDTADLGMRFGIHSGPVTAGVLRGERYVN